MKIKEKPGDFVVKEIKKLRLSQTGQYSYFLLRKTNLTTEQALNIVTKKFGLAQKQIGFAGNKDKIAVTEQHISIRTNREIRGFKAENLELAFLGRGKEGISLGDLEGNKFRIVVRDLAEKKNKTAAFFPNYFDDQRFGANGLNPEVGKALVRKDFAEACRILGLKADNNDFVGALRRLGRKRLLLYFHSCQSLIFNKVLTTHIKNSFGETFAANYSQGKLLFPKNPGRTKNFEIPLPNFDTESPKHLEKAYRAILKEERLSFDDFLIPQLPELVSETAWRKAFVQPKNFKCAYQKDDLHKNKLKAILTFTLPPGAYATALVKFLNLK